MRATLAAGISTSLMLAASGASCQNRKTEDLDKLGAVRITIKNQAFDLWIADDTSEQTQGLMFVTAERLAPLPDGTERGMIFIFDHEQPLSFWMRNTIIPLDIAYLDAAGKVVNTHTMAPLDERTGQYPSVSPAKYAIEVNAGVFGRIGLRIGDTVELSPSLLKRRP